VQELGQGWQVPAEGGDAANQHPGGEGGGGDLQKLEEVEVWVGGEGEEGPCLGLRGPAVSGQLQEGRENRRGQSAVKGVLRPPESSHTLLQLGLQAQSGDGLKAEAFECPACSLSYADVAGEAQEVKTAQVHPLAAGHFHVAAGDKSRNVPRCGVCLQLV